MLYLWDFFYSRLKDFAKLYDVIKNERNKCVNLIQTSTQKAAEMKEKIKILQNEIEILRTEVSKKDKSVLDPVLSVVCVLCLSIFIFWFSFSIYRVE